MMQRSCKCKHLGTSRISSFYFWTSLRREFDGLGYLITSSMISSSPSQQLLQFYRGWCLCPLATTVPTNRRLVACPPALQAVATLLTEALDDIKDLREAEEHSEAKIVDLEKTMAGLEKENQDVHRRLVSFKSTPGSP